MNLHDLKSILNNLWFVACQYSLRCKIFNSPDIYKLNIEFLKLGFYKNIR